MASRTRVFEVDVGASLHRGLGRPHEPKFETAFVYRRQIEVAWRCDFTAWDLASRFRFRPVVDLLFEGMCGGCAVWRLSRSGREVWILGNVRL